MTGGGGDGDGDGAGDEAASAASSSPIVASVDAWSDPIPEDLDSRRTMDFCFLTILTFSSLRNDSFPPFLIPPFAGGGGVFRSFPLFKRPAPCAIPESNPAIPPAGAAAGWGTAGLPFFR